MRRDIADLRGRIEIRQHTMRLTGSGSPRYGFNALSAPGPEGRRSGHEAHVARSPRRRRNSMRSMLKAAAAVAAAASLSGPASAGLTGDLKIFLDTSNPAPRATMEAMIARFGALHPGARHRDHDHRSGSLQDPDPQLPHRRRAGRGHLVRRQPHEALRVGGPVRGRVRPLAGAGDRAEPGVYQGRDDHRRQAMGRALHLLPVGRLLPRGHLQRAGPEGTLHLGGGKATAPRSSRPAGPATRSGPSSSGPRAAGSTT